MLKHPAIPFWLVYPGEWLMNARKEISRFIIAGMCVGATDFGIYLFLIHFLSINLAKGIAYTCGGIVAYFFNKHWVFNYNRPASHSEVGRYLIVSLLALGINILTNKSILNLRPDAVLLALILASMLTGLLTFIGFKWWVFRER
jgi:putative flippase GtrA